MAQNLNNLAIICEFCNYYRDEAPEWKKIEIWPIPSLTCWFPLVDKRLIPTAPLVSRFRLWTAIVKPTEVVGSNGIDQINGTPFF